MIINADDFGLDLDRDAGILLGAILGAINGISVIVTNKKCLYRFKCLGFIIEKIKKRVSIGLHLNLTDEILIKNNVFSLCKKYDPNKDGKINFWFCAMTGNLNRTAIIEEIDAQIGQFRSIFGKYPDHIDGHNHCHIADKKISEYVMSISNRLGIKHVRVPYEHVTKYAIEEIAENYNKDERIVQTYSRIFKKGVFISKLPNLALNIRESPLNDIFLYNGAVMKNQLNNNPIHFKGTTYGHIRKIRFLLYDIYRSKDKTEFMCHPGLFLPIKHKVPFSDSARMVELFNIICVRFSLGLRNLVSEDKIVFVSQKDL